MIINNITGEKLYPGQVKTDGNSIYISLDFVQPPYKKGIHVRVFVIHPSLPEEEEERIGYNLLREKDWNALRCASVEIK